MRKLLSLLLIVPFWIGAQTLEIDEKTGKYSVQEVVELDSLNKQVIHAKVTEWITLNYKSADDVIQLSTEDKLIIKGAFSTNIYFKEGWIRHTLIIQFKDNKFRYTYTNLSYFSPGSGNMNFEKPMFGKNKALAEAEENIKLSIKNITEYIRSSETETDDW